MKIALLKNYSKESSEALDELFKSVGMNSGNIVYWESIIRLFDPDIVSYKDSYKFKDYDAVIITDLCWIREGAEYDYIESYIDKYNIPFIPLSIGLQNKNFNPDFKLSSQVERMLKKMQERAVLGVRGEYTASILRKYGITNIAVIGCPSMYYWNNRNLKIEDEQKAINTCCNFKSFGEVLDEKEISILNYFAKRNFLFVGQTGGKLENFHIKDKKNFEFLHDYLEENTLLEFNYQKWVERLQEYNFSMGLRFHGNIIALHHNIKALFIAIDSRTQEMIDLFHLPYISKNDFEENKPLDYYFNLANYREFNENYRVMFDRFAEFVSKNKLIISKKAKPIDFEAKKNINPIKVVDKIKAFEDEYDKVLKQIQDKEIELNQLFIEIGKVYIQNKDKDSYYNLVQNFIDNKTEKEERRCNDENNLLKDTFIDNVGEKENCLWKSSHSSKSYFDKACIKLVCGDEKECWNILSQKIDFNKHLGKTLYLKVESKTEVNTKLNIFARYKMENGDIKYLLNKAVENKDKNIDQVSFYVPKDIPEKSEFNVGVYLNQPNSQAFVYSIKLYVN